VVEYEVVRAEFGVGSAERAYPELDRRAAAAGVNLRWMEEGDAAAAWYRQVGDRVYARARAMRAGGAYDGVEAAAEGRGGLQEALEELERAFGKARGEHPRSAVLVDAELGRRMRMTREAFLHALRFRGSRVDRVVWEVGSGWSAEGAAREIRNLARFGFPLDVIIGAGAQAGEIARAAYRTKGVGSVTVRGLEGIPGEWRTQGRARVGREGVVRVRGAAGLYRMKLKAEGRREAWYEGKVEAGRVVRAKLRPAPWRGRVAPEYASLSPRVMPEHLLDGAILPGEGPAEGAREVAAGEEIGMPAAAGWNVKLRMDFTVPGEKPLAAVQVFAGRRRLLFEELAPGSYRLEFETAGAERGGVMFVPGAGRAEKVTAGAISEVIE
jgi:hypothetical protein